MRFSRYDGSVLLMLLCSVAIVACDDLNDFKTSKHEIYRGKVIGIGPQDAGDGMATNRFLLYGFSSDAHLDLRIDPEAAARGESMAGRMDVYTCEDPSLEDCPADKRISGLFHKATLASIPGLSQDVLSRYDFPGPRRVRNYILTAPTADGSQLATVFVSLMESGKIELRIVASQVQSDAGVGAGAIFGLFMLERVST